MEGRKSVGSSSSSFTSELFGSKDSYPPPSSSKGIFGSIFGPPPPKVLGRESVLSEATERKHGASEECNSKTGGPDINSQSKQGESEKEPNRDTRSIYQDHGMLHPCHLSSSIYYGGRDVYSHPQSSQSSGVNSTPGNLHNMPNFSITYLPKSLSNQLSDDLNTISIRVMEEKTQELLQEGIGGKDPSITEVSSLAQPIIHILYLGINTRRNFIWKIERTSQMASS